MNGLYFYGDFCTGEIFTLEETAPNTWVSNLALNSGLSLASFGEDEAGELYVVDINGGQIFQIVGPPLPPNIPTVSQWGLILLTLLLLTCGTLLIARRRPIIATIDTPTTIQPQLDTFDSKLFTKILTATLALLAIGFAGALAIDKQLTTIDTVGALISAPLLSYLLQLWLLLVRQNENK